MKHISKYESGISKLSGNLVIAHLRIFYPTILKTSVPYIYYLNGYAV